MLVYKVKSIEHDPIFGDEITVKIENNYPVVNQK